MSKSARRTRSIILTALFAALTAIGAFLRIPVGPTSFTLQAFFTCAAGLLIGPWYGAASQAVYVLLGLAGVPIFTEGGGLMYVTMPTFGFLLGLIPMALVIGLMTRRENCGFWRMVLACVVGLVVLYAIGLPYMYIALNGAWSLKKTIISGCLIFLPFDALKIAVSSLLGLRLQRVLRR